MCRKVTCFVFSNTTAPLTPPSIEAPITTGSRSLRRSPRNAATEVNCPGHNATVFVAFACIGATPMASIAGNETNDPPPAIAFITPARNEAATNQTYCACAINEEGIQPSFYSSQTPSSSQTSSAPAHLITLLQRKKCHPERSKSQPIVTCVVEGPASAFASTFRKILSSQTCSAPAHLLPRKKCHPERSKSQPHRDLRSRRTCVCPCF